MVRKASLTSQPVPASSVLHLFDRLRPGQVRGVPWFAPVILKMRDLDKYDEAIAEVRSFVDRIRW